MDERLNALVCYKFMNCLSIHIHNRHRFFLLGSLALMAKSLRNRFAFAKRLIEKGLLPIGRSNLLAKVLVIQIIDTHGITMT
jgi:hypothetical protein